MEDIHHLETVDHSYIRYANVWEDATLLLEGLQIQESDKVLSIASAGDNCFAILSQNPSLVVGVDLNKVQLYLTELKKQAIAQMTQSEYIAFVGFRASNTRLESYQNIRTSLSSNCQTYWDGKLDIIEKGIIYEGKFEKYLATFAQKVLPFIHSKKRVKQLFEQKSASEQASFYEKYWDSFRWKWMFRIFFSKFIMGKFGRDPAFLAQVQTNVGLSIYKKTGIHLSSVHAQNNMILYFCLNGNFGHYLPYYAQEANYPVVQKNIHKLELQLAYAQEVTEFGSFDKFNLSNIFEYMDPQTFSITSKAFINIASNKAVFAYWNLLVHREINEIIPQMTRVEDVHDWSLRDEGFFYKQFVVNQYM